MSIQITGAKRFLFLTATVGRGWGHTQLPLGYVCHNYSLGQLSPSLVTRENTEAGNLSFCHQQETLQLGDSL